jgi:Ca2+/H+ antiporter
MPEETQSTRAARTNILHGAVHLILFLAFVLLIFEG